MKEVIFKYKIDYNKEIVNLPIGAQVLTVNNQGGDLYLWAKVNPDYETEARRFTVYGTGWDINDTGNHKFIGTVFMQEYVWHVFEILGKEG